MRKTHNFYFTFGQSHLNNLGEPMKDYWVRVEASSIGRAHELFVERFVKVNMPTADKWAFCYPEGKFRKAACPSGEYAVITEEAPKEDFGDQALAVATLAPVQDHLIWIQEAVASLDLLGILREDMRIMSPPYLQRLFNEYVFSSYAASTIRAGVINNAATAGVASNFESPDHNIHVYSINWCYYDDNPAYHLQRSTK